MAFNPIANFNQGVQTAQNEQAAQRQNQISGLQNSLTGQMQQGGFDPSSSVEMQQLGALDPRAAAGSLSVFQELDDSRQKAFFQDARKGREMLENQDFNGFLDLTSNRLDAIQKLGGDPSDVMSVLQTFNNGDLQGTIGQLKAAEQAGMQITDSKGRAFLSDPLDREVKKQRLSGDGRTATQKDFATFQDLTRKAMESGDPKDKQKAERFGRASRLIRETEQEKADIKVTQKEREAVAKANVARKQGFIDSGIESAKGAASVRRALNLLDEVETGGFDNLALKAKRLFGIEGANEGELSNLMGKAVLAQLKPIFGAAFTAREGDALAEIEAKFSNSSASNKRLLENALKLIDRAARRGIAAAENQGDDFTADEIRNTLAFKLEDKVDDTFTTETKEAVKKGGQMMTDANGNRAMVYPDGTFEEQ